MRPCRANALYKTHLNKKYSIFSRTGISRAVALATKRRINPLYKLNISAVSQKSSPNTAKDASTTVRVVARETPSGVGWA